MPALRVLRLLPPGGALPQAFQRSFRRHAPRASKRAGADDRSGPSAATSSGRALSPATFPRRALSFRCRLAPSGALLPLCRHALEYGAFAPPLCSRERDVRPLSLLQALRRLWPPAASLPPRSWAEPQAHRRRRPQWSFRRHAPGETLPPAVTFPRRALSFRCRLAPGGTLALREHDVSRETLHASGRILSIWAPASAERPSRRALRANSPSRRGGHRRCRSSGLSHG